MKLHIKTITLLTLLCICSNPLTAVQYTAGGSPAQIVQSYAGTNTFYSVPDMLSMLQNSEDVSRTEVLDASRFYISLTPFINGQIETLGSLALNKKIQIGLIAHASITGINRANSNSAYYGYNQITDPATNRITETNIQNNYYFTGGATIGIAVSENLRIGALYSHYRADNRTWFKDSTFLYKKQNDNIIQNYSDTFTNSTLGSLYTTHYWEAGYGIKEILRGHVGFTVQHRDGGFGLGSTSQTVNTYDGRYISSIQDTDTRGINAGMGSTFNQTQINKFVFSNKIISLNQYITLNKINTELRLSGSYSFIGTPDRMRYTESSSTAGNMNTRGQIGSYSSAATNRIYTKKYDNSMTFGGSIKKTAAFKAGPLKPRFSIMPSYSLTHTKQAYRADETSIIETYTDADYNGVRETHSIITKSGKISAFNYESYLHSASLPLSIEVPVSEILTFRAGYQFGYALNNYTSGQFWYLGYTDQTTQSVVPSANTVEVQTGTAIGNYTTTGRPQTTSHTACFGFSLQPLTHVSVDFLATTTASFDFNFYVQTGINF